VGTKYSSNAESGYNASPPSDDGSTAASNRVEWSKIKSKLGDPLKTLAEAINTDLVTALDTSARAIAGNDSSAAADHWRTIQVNTSSVTVTLADAATMAAGYIVNVANQSSGDITVALASAGDTIDGVTNTTNTLSTKEVREYIVNSTATGYITKSRAPGTASTTVAGLVELATQAEVSAMTDTTRAITSNHNKIILGTEQATTSGTSFDFTIPSGVRRITVMFEGVSTNGTNALLVQLGDAGGVEATGYSSGVQTGTTAATVTTGFAMVNGMTAAGTTYGMAILCLKDSSDFTWVCTSNATESATGVSLQAGFKSLSQEATTVRLTAGGNTFDAGSVNISYER
jgi:hypothetical protein